MAYRRTQAVVKRLAARRSAILAAARATAAEAGMAAVQIAPVADRADVAAGTVYRYFPSKADLVSELIADVCPGDPARRGAAAPPTPRQDRCRRWQQRSPRLPRTSFPSASWPGRSSLNRSMSTSCRRGLRAAAPSSLKFRRASTRRRYAGNHLPQRDFGADRGRDHRRAARGSTGRPAGAGRPR